MKNKRIKNLIKVLVFTILLITGIQLFNNVNAAINTNYGDQTESENVDLDKKIESSALLDYIGSFIYALGNIVEKVTAGILSIAGAGNIFPWSDKVIFNTIPILDVNFINPDSNSLLSTTGTLGIGEVVRNVYFTGLTIALGFLGIIIAILAIKLAISTIGSEKAKYKEAIVKWLTSLVLLFGMHFVIAFLFFLNENLVEVASQMLETQTQKYGQQIQEKMQEINNENADEIIDNFISALWDDLCNLWNMSWDTMKENVDTMRSGDSNVLEKLWSSLKVTLSNADLTNALLYYDEMVQFENLLKSNGDLTYALLSSETARSELLASVKGNDAGNSFWTDAAEELVDSSVLSNILGANSTVNTIRRMKEVINSCINGPINDRVQEVINGETTLAELTADATSLEKTLYTVTYNKEKYGSASAGGTSFSVITTLGEYFKQAAWYTDVDNGGWAPNQVSIIAAILYTMFVFQSISFFIAYIKRFFYVVILAVLAPLVVIYDFLGKSVSL